MQKATDEGVDYCRRRVNTLKENIEAIGKVSSDFCKAYLFCSLALLLETKPTQVSEHTVAHAQHPINTEPAVSAADHA